MRLRSRSRTILAAFAVPLMVGPGAAATQAGSPRPGGPTVLTAVVGPRQAAFTRSFNPFRNDADSRWPTWAGIHEPLIICNRATGQFTPWLATGYTWTADNLKLRFALRGGVRWSDGEPFTARDVAFTFDLMRRHPVLDHDRQKHTTLNSTVRPDSSCSSGGRRSTRRPSAITRLSSRGQKTRTSSGTTSTSAQPVEAVELRDSSSGRAGSPTMKPQMAARPTVSSPTTVER